VRVVGSAGGARTARRSPLVLVSSRRHIDPCMRFSRTRLIADLTAAQPLPPREAVTIMCGTPGFGINRRRT